MINQGLVALGARYVDFRDARRKIVPGPLGKPASCIGVRKRSEGASQDVANHRKVRRWVEQPPSRRARRGCDSP